VYTSEFPVESPVPTFEPTLLVGITLVVLAVAVLAFYLGKLAGKKDERWRDVPKTIHEAVKAKCVAATSAPSGELLLKAQELVEEVKGRVGPVLAFGSPAAEALKGIEKAINGETPADDKAKAKDKEKDKSKSKGEHGKADDKHGHGAGHDDHGAHPAGGHDPDGSGRTSHFTIVGGHNVLVAAHQPPPHPPHHPPEECPEPPVVIDHKEHIRQVRLAVVDFSDFWSRGDCLVDLQKCQKALTETTAGPKKLHDAHH
jgi:uncharacterized protein YoxC